MAITMAKIGEHTNAPVLELVTIARDCTYYPTSFPDNCTVNFYPD